MKLLQVGDPGHEVPGVLADDGRRLDATEAVRSVGAASYDERFFAAGGLDAVRRWVADAGADAPVLDGTARLGPAIARPSKIVCVGLNFRDHAEETGAELPPEPVLFAKASSAWCGPDDDLVLPRGSVATDWEVELAVVIGTAARYVTEYRALDHVAGYALHNDYSERDHQLARAGQWVKGKSHDTYAPFGPFLATPDEFPDGVDALPMWLDVNGTRRQDSTTAHMVFGVAHLVSYISEFMTLLPGDVISTGTPAGVGLGFDPPVYLSAGDVVELGIEGLGRQRQRVVAP